MDDHDTGGLRRITQGAVTATVRRSLAGRAELELVTEGVKQSIRNPNGP